ncbi:MAG: NAD(P)H-hydrate dehydratase [Candidatus Pacebacteria bacterium CG10_big_fil_rev_8_21_14_0_10_56_10]|nr:MAG: NAD(P)H-hydrate dehydratase [Candidatus Pacebacteria bacterium CG10_big_fil_rev_8_21_14_0_10_56_10]
MNLSSVHLQPYFERVTLAQPDSHKGQNGKLLVIGGSQLFHAASKWSLDVAARIVDMVFYSSVPDNNELVKQAKRGFWDGIVVPRDQLSDYLEEADCVLIGPGMERDGSTAELTNRLIGSHPDKRWVIDAGALQMLDRWLLGPSHLITPHRGELERLLGEELADARRALAAAEQLVADTGCTVLLKGKVDRVVAVSEAVDGDADGADKVTHLEITGGNPGMTKGGTGDVLAGLVASLYCRSQAVVAAVVGSYVNKRAGDELYQNVGQFFSANDLAAKVPEVLWEVVVRG